MEEISEVKDSTYSGQELASELADLLPVNPEAPEASRVDAMLQKFGAEQHNLVSVGGIEVIGLGDKEQLDKLAPAAQVALERLQARFDGRLGESFPGLKVYFADGVIDGGGEALADENAIIMDASKAAMSVQDVEELLVGVGELNAGDWVGKVGGEISYGEITLVHEMGHMLEAKAHNQEGVAFAGLSLAEAPTKYGSKAHNEDYAESFFSDVYGIPLNSARKKILDADIEKVAQPIAA